MSKDEVNPGLIAAFEELEAFDPASPEKELLRAILVTALGDLKKTGSDRRKATEFFLSPDDDYIFSFLSICSYLNVDPQKVLLVAGLNTRDPDRHEKVRN